MIAQGTLLIDIERKKVEQVNGLAVLDLGGYAFGRPSRVMIPAANVRNLILRADVVHAGDKGEFHIYPVLTISEFSPGGKRERWTKQDCSICRHTSSDDPSGFPGAGAGSRGRVRGPPRRAVSSGGARIGDLGQPAGRWSSSAQPAHLRPDPAHTQEFLLIRKSFCLYARVSDCREKQL